MPVAHHARTHHARLHRHALLGRLLRMVLIMRALAKAVLPAPSKRTKANVAAVRRNARHDSAPSDLPEAARSSRVFREAACAAQDACPPCPRIDPHQSRTARSRSALPITDTEDRLMAAAAMIGLSSSPVNGYRTPAAIGTPSAL